MSDTTVVIIGYVVAVVLGLALWLLAKFELVPLSKVGEMIERIMHHRTTRIAIILAWWWVGWHFLVNEVIR